MYSWRNKSMNTRIHAPPWTGNSGRENLPSTGRNREQDRAPVGGGEAYICKDVCVFCFLSLSETCTLVWDSKLQLTKCRPSKSRVWGELRSITNIAFTRSVLPGWVHLGCICYFYMVSRLVIRDTCLYSILPWKGLDCEVLENVHDLT